MAVPSKLLEHVVKRLNDRVLSELKLVQKVETKVSKLKPPVMGDVQAVCVKMTKLRA
jgi:dihydroneopterin aldolase